MFEAVGAAPKRLILFPKKQAGREVHTKNIRMGVALFLQNAFGVPDARSQLREGKNVVLPSRHAPIASSGVRCFVG
jgi:hypothetical protein